MKKLRAKKLAQKKPAAAPMKKAVKKTLPKVKMPPKVSVKPQKSKAQVARDKVEKIHKAKVAA